MNFEPKDAAGETPRDKFKFIQIDAADPFPAEVEMNRLTHKGYVIGTITRNSLIIMQLDEPSRQEELQREMMDALKARTQNPPQGPDLSGLYQ